MKFQKGHKINSGRTPWNKGRTETRPEILQKIALNKEKGIYSSKGFLGKKHTEISKEKNREKHLGKKLSEEHRKKMSLSRKGKIFSEEHRAQISKSNKGRKFTQEHINHITGENNGNWKGGITPVNMRIRKSPEYKLWREAVFKRDNFTCIWCGVSGGKLNADHIKPFAIFSELRFAVNNGRTLCEKCHKKTDTYGYKASKKI